MTAGRDGGYACERVYIGRHAVWQYVLPVPPHGRYAAAAGSGAPQGHAGAAGAGPPGGEGPVTADVPRPEVVVVQAGEVRYPLDETLRFVGYDDDGCARWEAYGPADQVLTALPRITVGVLPPRCRLAVPIEPIGAGLWLFGRPGDVG